MPILIYRYNIIIKSDVYLYMLFKPTFFKPPPFSCGRSAGSPLRQTRSSPPTSGNSPTLFTPIIPNASTASPLAIEFRLVERDSVEFCDSKLGRSADFPVGFGRAPGEKARSGFSVRAKPVGKPAFRDERRCRVSFPR